MTARILAPLVLLLCFCTQLHAQIKVDLQMPHRLFVAYEPIVATVTITNLSGRDMQLEDVNGNQWFGFQIMTLDDSPIGPRDIHYKLEPLSIEPGQSVKRSVNLVSLYPVTEFGLYRVKATVFFAPLNRYFTSAAQNIEVTEGKTIWQQTVGVPQGEKGDGYRIYNVMTHRLPAETRLYVRIEDRDKSLVYATYPIGRLMFAETPEILLDDINRLHIMHEQGPRTYLHTVVGLNGEFVGQTVYTSIKDKNVPRLRKDPGGKVTVIGGIEEKPVAEGASTPPPAKLSERPPGLPKL